LVEKKLNEERRKKKRPLTAAEKVVGRRTENRARKNLEKKLFLFPGDSENASACCDVATKTRASEHGKSE